MALRKLRKEPPFDKPTAFDPDLAVEADGRVMVDFTAKVTPTILSQITSSGGTVISHFESMNAIRARVPLTQVEALAALEGVQFISPAAQATTNSATGQGSSPQAGGGAFFPSETKTIDDNKP